MQSTNFSSKIKIFSDGADPASMLEMAENPLISGMTTNPSLMKKAGISDYRSFSKDILTKITNKPISFEVLADDFSEMRRQALEIASWGDNVYVKIPVMNCEGKSTVELVDDLSHQNVKLNVTAILTIPQVLEACQALKGGSPSIVSVFAGRIADTGRDPIPVMQAALEICRSISSETELLWASTRELLNIMQAEEIGCQIITVPFGIIRKLSLVRRDLHDYSLDTVRTFKKDADQAGYSL